MSDMEKWQQMLEAQEAERDKLRVNQITVEVEEKKKSKSKVYNVKKTIQYGLVHRNIDDETLIGKYELYFADTDRLTQQDHFGDNTTFGGVIYIALSKEEGKLIMMYGTR
ncbi:5-hydroxyisourate hydrolase-like protein (transthyretin family) [Paenibacillus turicensis]|uniref:5-hydroxyisourate hydrolase-like protein (Transthyretin family) n=1 Tax=Paenibacillus turicensis TaxID=160487 RepID=A0ABS4FYN3_9BACL|nr:hypothetical protein [Paenibacillus turicensis]MBP1907685.1 5-hydroxyisourate hydrolase-like protein (transthyretin family) [Paenibacillus turicensis]